MTQVPSGQLSLREHARCHEVIRALKPQIQDPLFPPLLVVARFGLSPAAEEARYCLVALDRAPRFWLFPTG